MTKAPTTTKKKKQSEVLRYFIFEKKGGSKTGRHAYTRTHTHTQITEKQLTQSVSIAE